MALRHTVLPLGFGLSAVLLPGAAGSFQDPQPEPTPTVRVYTNEDLERVHPLRHQTGVTSVPATSPQAPPSEHASRPRARGEEYWRRAAERVRSRVRALEAQARTLRLQLAERMWEREHLAWRPGAATSGLPEARLQERIASLERRARQLEDELAERARRAGALPGWLR